VTIAARKADERTILWRVATTGAGLFAWTKAFRPTFMIVIDDATGDELARATFLADRDAANYAIAQRSDFVISGH